MKVMLTTIDNPFNPFVDFDSWLNYDMRKGYNSINVLARIAKFSDSLTEEENDRENEQAIDDIVEADFTGKWIKVNEETAKLVAAAASNGRRVDDPGEGPQ